MGRILRQPNAKKTGNKLLDESYVYYSQGSSQNILIQISYGFEKEGLEDLKGNINIIGGANQFQPKKVKIQNKFKRYSYSFFLPVWIFVKNDKEKRRFNYSVDIKSKLDFINFDLSKDQFNKIKSSLSKETKERKVLIVSLNDESHMMARGETESIENRDKINVNYLSRRLAEIVDNPFVARDISEKFLNLFRKNISELELSEHFGYIISELLKIIIDSKSDREEKIFKKYLDQKKLELVISDRNDGFKIPESFSMRPNNNIFNYEHYLFDDFEIDSLNTLEKDVAELLENQEKILWWFRNRESKDWYSIQGWKENKIHPDFVAAKKSNKGKLEIVYVLESKGDYLEGNLDTNYKRKVLDILNNSKKNIYKQGKFDFDQFNDKIEYYVVPEKEKDQKIKELYK